MTTTYKITIEQTNSESTITERRSLKLKRPLTKQEAANNWREPGDTDRIEEYESVYGPDNKITRQDIYTVIVNELNLPAVIKAIYKL